MDGVTREQRKTLRAIEDGLEDVKKKLGRIWRHIETTDTAMADASDRIREHRDRQEDTHVRTAARMSRMSLPIFVACIPALSNTGILGRSWRPLWEPESPRLPLSALRAYQWDSLHHRMRHRPVGGIDRADASLSPLHAGWGVQNGISGVISEVHRPPNHP